MTDTSRKLDPESTRNAILDAAEELFVEVGVDGASMSAIAARADVTKSLIHHHFGSKSELWERIKERAIGEYLEMQRELLETEPANEGLLLRSVEVYFRFLQKRPALVRLMSWMLLEPDQCIDKRDDAVMQLGCARLREAMEAGVVRPDIDPQAIILMFLSLVERWFQAKQLYELEWAGDPDEIFLDTIQKVIGQGMKSDQLLRQQLQGDDSVAESAE